MRGTRIKGEPNSRVAAGWSALKRSLRRHDAEVLGGLGEAGALRLDGGVELGRSTGIRNLAGERQALLDDRVGRGFADVRRDAVAQFRGHAGPAEEADQSVERQVG